MRRSPAGDARMENRRIQKAFELFLLTFVVLWSWMVYVLQG